MTSDTALPVDSRFTTFDLERSNDWPTEANHKAGRRLYNVIDWAGYHRGQIALTADEHAAINPLRALSSTRTDLWEPIETAPKDGRKIDLYDAARKRRAPDCYWHKKRGQWNCRWDDGDGYSALRIPFNPTHWQPLPARPITTEGE